MPAVHMELSSEGKIALFVNNEEVDLSHSCHRNGVLRGGVAYSVQEDLAQGSVSVPALGFKLSVVSDGSSLN